MTHRNPEKLDPKLWEDAGLRPLTKREIRGEWQRSHWLIHSALKGWMECPHVIKNWTICIPSDLPTMDQAQATTQPLKVMLLEAKLAKAEARVEELGAALESMLMTGHKVFTKKEEA